MVGAKKPHIIIASNLITMLNNHLDNTPCIVLNSDIKVRLEEADCYYYPDVAVTCVDFHCDIASIYRKVPGIKNIQE